MKFSAQLKTSQIKQWQDFYVDYEKIKALMYDKFVTQRRPNIRSSAPAAEMLMCVAFKDDFEVSIVEESKRVNQFFLQSLRSFATEAQLLQTNYEALGHDAHSSPDNSNLLSVRHAMTDLYRRFHYLKSFCIVNYTAFVKLLKKHDKLAAGYSQDHNMPPHALELGPELLAAIEKMEFHNWALIDEELSRLEDVFAGIFCHNNKLLARGELLMTQRTGSKRGHFWLGFKCGSVVLSGMWVLWDCVVDEQLRSAHTKWDDPSYQIYAGLWGIVLLMWLWGCNVYVWNRYRINYRYILELGERSAEPIEIISSASSITLLFLLNFLIFYKAQRAQQHDLPSWTGGWHSRLVPLALFVYMLIRAIFPWRDRRVVWVTVLHIVRAPSVAVRFRDFYAADVWTSLVKPSVNLTFGLCYYVTGSFVNGHDVCSGPHGVMRVLGPALSALPLWCRFMQCIRRYYDSRQRFPHLANAGKYALSHTIVFISVFASNSNYNHAYQGFWIVSLVLSTLYTFSWDVKMDWNLGSRSLKPDIFQLRPRLMFQRKWVYYVAIVADLVMRFLWTLTLISFSKETPIGFAFSKFLQPILASVELLRRTMWGCFRLEAEHLHNTEGFRTVDVIPLHFATPTKPDKDEPESTMWTKIEVVTFCVLVAAFGVIALLAGSAWA